MQNRFSIVRIQQNIGVENDHRAPVSSKASSNSVTQS